MTTPLAGWYQGAKHALEAIVRSTFVLIAQNRQTACQQARADHDFQTADQELESNTDLTRAIHDRLISGERRREDRDHDGIASQALGSFVASDERDAQRDRGERIAAVMNQVREQRNRPRQHKHDGLQRGSHREDAETPCDRLHPFARPDNGGNNHAVDMVVPVAMLIATRDRTERQTGVPVRPVVTMLMAQRAMAMHERATHRAPG